MKNLDFISRPRFNLLLEFKINNRKTNLCHILFWLFITLSISAQPCDINQPCRSLSGPIFPDLPTLCESVTGFDADFTIRDESYASSLGLILWPYYSPTAFYGVDILIQGDFYIDEPVSFINCRIKMASGAQIIVTDESFTNEILALNSKFFSCDDMWKGIVLENSTRCRFFSCKIEDAQFAFTVDQDVSLTLYGNLFNRNFVSITNATENTTLPFLLLKNNTFDCTSELSDYYDLNFVNINEDPVTFAGILLNDCSSAIGFVGSRNRFNNLNYGIFANNSTVNIDGCSFNNSQHTTVIPDFIQEYPLAGCGVAGYNSSVFMIGNSVTTSCSFKNSDLLVEGCNLAVTYTDFEDGFVSARENFNGETVRIEDNTFDGVNKPSGISVKRSMASGEEAHTIISRNYIQHLLTPFPPIGALQLNGTFNPTDIAIVSENTIKSGGISYAGIRLTPWASQSNIIDDNNIQWAETDEQVAGIYTLLGRSRGTVIINDSIKGGSVDTLSQTYGINSWAASLITYCNNYVDVAGHGMKFWGDCNTSLISENQLDELGIGLHLQDVFGIPGIFGVQNGTKNKWILGNNYDFSAENLSSLDLEFNKYKVKTTDASDVTLNPSNINPSTDWFAFFTGENEICVGNGPINGFDSLIMTSEPYFDNLAEPVRFYLEKGLIAKLLDDNLETPYSTYLSSVNTTSEYLIAQAEIDMKDAMQMDLTDQTDLDDYLNEIRVLFDSISLYDNYNYSNIDSTTFTVGLYLDSIQSKLEQINIRVNSREVIKSSRMTTLLADLSDIEDDLNNITPRGTFDANYIDIYLLMIKKITEGTLDPADYVLLNAIAQDYADSSLSNLTAFAFFDLCDSNPYPEYTFKCEEESPMKSKKAEVSEKSAQKLTYPVSISHSVVTMDAPFPGYIAIYDLTGRIISIKHFDRNTTQFYLDEKLLPGVYYYYLVNSSKNTVFKSGLIPIVR